MLRTRWGRGVFSTNIPVTRKPNFEDKKKIVIEKYVAYSSR